jgi:hypothetical protein
MPQQYDLIIDCGNSAIKAKNGSGREAVIPHHLVELSEAAYSQIMELERGTPSSDYLRVNGVPFVVGNKALQYDPRNEPVRGNERYTKSYVGTLLAATVASMYKQGGDFRVFASYPPGDLPLKDDLLDALFGDYEVTIRGKNMYFSVSYVNAYEEPEGGLFNVLLNDEGTRYDDPEIMQGETLVIDIGGWTFDMIGVNDDMSMNYNIHESAPLGILQVERSLERLVFKRYPYLKKGTVKIPPQLIKKALRNPDGKLLARGDTLDISHEIRIAKNELLASIRAALTGIGGLVRFHTIIVTGGGGAMLYNDLLDILDHGRVKLAAPGEYAHLANVRGGLKLWRMLEAVGEV